MCLNAYKNDIPSQGRISAGVRGIALNEGDKVVFAGQIDDGGEILVGTDGNTIKRVIVSQIDPMARYRKGVKIVDLGSNRSVVYADYVTMPYKIAVKMDDGRSSRRIPKRRFHRGPHDQGQGDQTQKGLQGDRLLVYEIFVR